MLASDEARAEAQQSAPVIRALAEELASRRRCSTATPSGRWPRACAPGPAQKGKALFHPIRLVLTGEPEGLELDAAVPAIERGALLAGSDSGLRPIASARTAAAARRCAAAARKRVRRSRWSFSGSIRCWRL